MAQTAQRGPLFVGVDVGGTFVKVGVVDDGGHSLSQVKVPTEADRGSEAGLANICRAVDQAVESCDVSIEEISAIGIGAPGTMDIPGGMLLEPHNLTGWHNVPILKRISEHFSKPAVLQNDANAAAYGEYWVGAGRDAHSMVMWTLGTGIGCGIIVGDMIIEGEHSHGSESGHLIIDITGARRCASGQYGTLEAYAGGRSLIARCRETLDTGRQSLLRDWTASGDELTPLLIARAAEQGDELADQLVMETAMYMGVGTVCVMHTVDPTMILFGGGMTFGRNETPLGRRFLNRIQEEVRARAFPIPRERTIIEYASLGGDAGYIGAAGCARRHFRRRQERVE